MKSLVITFSGIDGSGKSTQIEKLSKYLAKAGIPVHTLALWDDVALFRDARSHFSRTVLQSDSAVGTPGRPVKRKDKNTQTGPVLFGRSILYMLDLISLRQKVLRARAEISGVIIFDRYIYDQLAALPMQYPLTRAYTKFLLSFTPKPDLSYVLDAEPEDARARKPEYPLDFLHQYRNSFLQLSRIAGLHLVRAGTTQDVHLAVIDYFNRSAFAPAPQPQVSSEVVA